MVSQSVSNQIIVGVVIGVTVLVITGFFKKKVIAPPVVEDSGWWGW